MSLALPLAYPAHAERLIELDIEETDAAYTVRAEIPGVRRQDIEITLYGSEVLLRTQASSRSFSLPARIDSRSAAVEFQNGLLTLTLPKRTDTSGNKVFLELRLPALHMGRAGAYPALSQP